MKLHRKKYLGGLLPTYLNVYYKTYTCTILAYDATMYVLQASSQGEYTKTTNQAAITSLLGPGRQQGFGNNNFTGIDILTARHL